MVTLQIIGQEADAAFQGHELGAPGQGFFFQIGQGAARGLQKAFGVALEQGQAEVYLGEVRLVLGAVVGAEADGVAVIVGGKARHHGVQIDHADALAGGLIHENIVELGVVVGHAKGEFPFGQKPHHVTAVRLAGRHKIDLGLNAFGAAAHVGSQGFFKVCIAVHGVVEFADGLVQGGGGIAGQLALKVAEGHGALVKILGGFGLLQAQGALDKGIHPPGAAVGIGVVVFALLCGHHVHGLAHGIAALLLDHAAQVAGHAADVLHQALGVGEGVGVDALQDIAHTVAGFILHVNTEGIVDVARAVAQGPGHLAVPVPGGKRLGQDLFRSILHNAFSPPTACQGTRPRRFFR